MDKESEFCNFRSEAGAWPSPSWSVEAILTAFDENGKIKPMIKLNGTITPNAVRSRGIRERYSPVPTRKTPRTPRIKKICTGCRKQRTNNVTVKTVKAR